MLTGFLEKVENKKAKCRNYIKSFRVAKLQPLIPTRATKENSFYIKQLETAIRNRHIRNIALSGDYGTGKSSILLDLRKKYAWRGLGYVKVISFMTLFSDKLLDNNTENNNETDEEKREMIRHKVQREIFRQLFYGETPGKLGASRYSRLGRCFAWQRAVLAVALSIVLSFCLSEQQIDTLAAWPISWRIIFCILASWIINMTVTLVARFLQNITIKGVGVFAVSLNFDETKSAFELMADELIYFFKRTGCRIVVIEDLDRFQDPMIYEELRQLNKLVNDAKHIHHKVSFVYALRDSLIEKPEDRAKIFDIIVPVVPFMTTVNALDQIMKVFRIADFDYKAISEVLKILARNITDMRTIKCICNTAVTMRAKLGDNQGNLCQVVALAAIRELYPSEYESMRKGSGLLNSVYDSFQKKRAAEIKNATKKIYDRQQVPNKKLKDASDALWNIISAPLASNANYTFSVAQSSNSDITESTLKEIDFWERFIEDGKISLDITYTSAYYPQKQLPKTITYDEVKNEPKIWPILELLSEDLDYYRRHLNEVSKTNNLTSFNNDVSGLNEITKDFVNSGIIDATYKFYLYPANNSAESPTLRQFRLDCLNTYAANFSHHLTDDDIIRILEESDDLSLQSPAFYNHYIITYLIKHKDERLSSILAKAQNQLDKFFEFYDFECLTYNQQINADYGDTIDGDIISKGGLAEYINDDAILYLTRRIAELYPERLFLHLLSSAGSLRDDIAREALVIAACLSLTNPQNIVFTDSAITRIASFLDYYENTITLNGGGINLAKLRIANQLSTSKLECYKHDEQAFNLLVDNGMFVINDINLKLASLEAVIDKLEKDGLSQSSINAIFKTSRPSFELGKYCIERPDFYSNLSQQKICDNITNFIKRNHLILPKEQIMSSINHLSVTSIVDILLASNLSWQDYKEIFASMPMPYCNLQPNKRPVLPLSRQNKQLLERLRSFGVVSSSTVHDNYIRIIMKIER